MLSINNDLFEWAKVKFELEFINKHRHIDRYENIKLMIKNNLCEISMNGSEGNFNFLD